VESLTGEYLSANVNGPGLTGATAQKLEEGYPLFSYFVREFSGYNAMEHLLLLKILIL